MSSSNSYKPRFYEQLERTGVDISGLPGSLQQLMEKFENAKKAWESSGQEERKYLHALVKTDALIASRIYQLYKIEPQENPSDKSKLLALKAKALLLKKRKLQKT